MVYIMSEMYCDICNITFTKKQAFKNHYTTKSHIKKATNETKKYSCHCGKVYLHRQSLYKHSQICTHQSQVTTVSEDSKDEQIETLQKRIDELELAAKQQKPTMIQNANEINNTTNNTQNIHINCYGKEDLSYITNEFMKQLVNAPFTSIQTLTRHIHFNDEHPENQNVKVTNKKLPYASIHKDGKWQITDRSKLTEDIMQKKYSMIDTKYEEVAPSLSDRKKDRFERFQYQYDTLEQQKQIKKDLDLCLLGGTEL